MSPNRNHDSIQVAIVVMQCLANVVTYLELFETMFDLFCTSLHGVLPTDFERN